MAKMGTVGWMDAGQGKLRFRDQMALIFQGVRAKAAVTKSRKTVRKARYCEVEDILPPDSEIATESLSLLQTAGAPYLVHHSLRAYFWARLLDGGHKKFDDEAVFTALMFHDLGLTDPHRLVGDTYHCFTHVGAREAQKLTEKHGWSDTRSSLVANAITLHLNILIGDEHGREAQLVQGGTLADVTGLGLDILHEDQIEQVLVHHPRLNMKENILNPLMLEAKERPCCRIAFLQKKFDFRSFIKKAPFAE